MGRYGAWLRRVALAVLLVCLLWPASAAQALAVPPAPKDIPVVDQTNTLTSEQKQALAAKIAKERAATGNQIAVLMIKSLQGESLEDYSLNVARQWGVGQKERNSGVLLFVAKNDHKLRIEVGYGLEGALPDIRAAHIIQERITPQFRQDKFYEGIDSGIDGIVAAIHGEKDPALETKADQPGFNLSHIPFEAFWVLLFLPVWLGSILARSKSWWAGGVIGGVAGVIIGIIFGFLFVGVIGIVVLMLLGLLLDKVVSDNYQKAVKHKGSGPPSWWAGGPWLGGGPGGSSSGGGFGGFSGGSFGGGGSSGSW